MKKKYMLIVLTSALLLSAAGCHVPPERENGTVAEESMTRAPIGEESESARMTVQESITEIPTEQVYYLRTPAQPFEEELAYPVMIYDSYEKACREADKGKYYAEGYAVYDGEGSFLYGHHDEFVTEMLYHAKHVADFIKANQYTYGNAANNPAVTYKKYREKGRLGEKVVSCDRFVGWVLYEMGYTDQPTNTGLVVWNNGSEYDLGAYLTKKGFEKITDASDLQAGDIVFVNPATTSSGTVYPAHVFLCAGATRASGTYYRYDAGSENRIRCEAVPGKGSDYSAYNAGGQPFVEPIHNFMFAYRYVEGRTEKPGVE